MTLILEPLRVARALSLAALVASTLVSSQSAIAQTANSTWEQIRTTKKLRLCAALSEPWYFKDTSNSQAAGAVKAGNSTWRGVGPALAEAIAKGMRVELEIVDVTWGTAVAALLANQCDVMFILNATPERALSVEFVNSPVLYYRIAGLVKPEFPLKSWADLNNPSVRLGVVLGSSTDGVVTRLAPKATITRYQTMGESLAAWQANRVDAAFTGTPTVDLTLARMKSGRTLVPTPEVNVIGSAAIRMESDRRWSSYLSTVITYFYEEGITQQFYNDFMAFRGLDPAKAASIQR